MSDDRRRWRELDGVATPGPWDANGMELSFRIAPADADFIAAARIAWPAAEREAEQLRALLRQVRADCDADERSSVNLAVIRERIDQFGTDRAEILAEWGRNLGTDEEDR